MCLFMATLCVVVGVLTDDDIGKAMCLGAAVLNFGLAILETLLANELLHVQWSRPHKCPECGAKITTTVCVGCLIEKRKREVKHGKACRDVV